MRLNFWLPGNWEPSALQRLSVEKKAPGDSEKASGINILAQQIQRFKKFYLELQIIFTFRQLILSHEKSYKCPNIHPCFQTGAAPPLPAPPTDPAVENKHRKQQDGVRMDGSNSATRMDSSSETVSIFFEPVVLD